MLGTGSTSPKHTSRYGSDVQSGQQALTVLQNVALPMNYKLIEISARFANLARRFCSASPESFRGGMMEDLNGARVAQW
jgi:hypothetical protein